MKSLYVLNCTIYDNYIILWRVIQLSLPSCSPAQMVNSEAFTGCPGTRGQSSSAATTPAWSWSCTLCCAWKQSIWKLPWGGKGAVMERQGCEQTERLCVWTVLSPSTGLRLFQDPPALPPYLLQPWLDPALLPDTGDTRKSGQGSCRYSSALLNL